MKYIKWAIGVLVPTLFWSYLLIAGIEWELITQISMLSGFFVYG